MTLFLPLIYLSPGSIVRILTALSFTIPSKAAETNDPFLDNVVVFRGDLFMRSLKILPLLVVLASVNIVNAFGAPAAEWTTTGPYGALVNATVTDPTNPDIVYAATSVSVFRSTDRGSTWMYAGAGLPQGSSEAIAIDPVNPTTLYLASSAGLSRPSTPERHGVGSTSTCSPFRLSG